MILKERDAIKEAVRRNFPRQWRDRLEEKGHQLTGPFTHLMTRMGINTVSTLPSIDPESPIRPKSSKNKLNSPKKMNGTGGQNEVMRSSLSPSKIPYREGRNLTLPKIKNIDDSFVVSGEVVESKLKADQSFTSKLFALSDDK